jgi:transketolase
MKPTELDNLCVNTIKMLAVDAVEKAASGHPGAPMGLAEIAYVLWTKHLRFNPKNPSWPNRDRFILSAGHASMLLYSMLHLTGYDLSLHEIKQFRQLDSRTPGHPEYGHTPGVEITTGPLGQGFAAGVGMGIAERYLKSWFNRQGHDIVDYHIYAICSDGDLMEGISSEAASLAGHLGLDNLVYIYDDNRISIEGSTDIAFTEDVTKRFEAYGWYVQEIDGHDMDAINLALISAKAQTGRPSLIRARTHIAHGCPAKQDDASSHGEPLGADEVKRTKENIGWPLQPDFYVPEKALNHMQKAVNKGIELEDEWHERFSRYSEAFPELAEEWERGMEGLLPAEWEKAVPLFNAPGEMIATRDASGKIMNGIAKTLPMLIGGSADLSPSTKTYLNGLGDFTSTESGRNLHFGVREHCMGACLNGMALTKPIIPFGSTFLIFSDYMRPSMRLAALMKAHCVYVFTHDSVFLGEDGPTHQPIEQLASLRAIPNMTVIRPADASETAIAWKVAIEHRDGPVALVLSRQKLPVLDRTTLAPAKELENGAYIIRQAKPGHPDIILIATGSEVHTALSAAKLLENEGLNPSVVNMPSMELFERMPEKYREQVLPPDVMPRISIEAGSPFGWHKFVGPFGQVVGINRFGASAPYKTLESYFGFTPEIIAEEARAVIERHARQKGPRICV